MKVALILPSGSLTKSSMPPLGLAWLAAVLVEKKLAEVSIIDMNAEKYSFEDLQTRLEREGPDIVGVTCTTWNRFDGFKAVKIAKKLGCTTIMGGPHVSFVADNVLKSIPEIDLIVRGEGEETFAEVVEKIGSNGENKPLHEALAGIKGTSYKKIKEIIHEEDRPFIQNLDSLPLPARNLLPMEKYDMTLPFSDTKATNVMTSRGCPQGCVYCSTSHYWGRRVRFRSIDRVLDEIEMLIEKYKLRGVYFFDDTFTINPTRTLEFTKKVKERGLDFEWFCEARANTIDEDLIRKMAETGCRNIAMGVESGSQRILNNIKKGIKVEQVLNVKNLAEKYGIHAKYFILLSLPGESPDDLKMTLRLSQQLGYDNEIHWNVARILPGTELEKIAINEGVMPKDFDWSAEWVDPNEQIIGKDVLGTAGHNLPIYIPPTLSPQEVKKAFKYPWVYSGNIKNIKLVASRIKKIGLAEAFKKIFKYLNQL